MAKLGFHIMTTMFRYMSSQRNLKRLISASTSVPMHSPSMRDLDAEVTVVAARLFPCLFLFLLVWAQKIPNFNFSRTAAQLDI